VADVAFYYGDNVPNQVPLKYIDPRLGEGYDYDIVNSDVILNRMTVRNGKIFLPDGMSYHVLVLPERKAISMEVLEKIERLVKAGATIIGTKPETTVGLRNMTKVEKIADALWGKINGTTVTENVNGKGRVVWGKTIRETLTNKGVVADFTYLSNDDLQYPDARSGRSKNHIQIPQTTFIDYIHRTIQDTKGNDSIQIYYVVNRLERPEWLQCGFRVAGLQPEIWYPESGKTVPVNIYVQKDGHTCLPLHLDPFGSAFVVFRRAPQQEPVIAIQLDGVELFPTPSAISQLESPFFAYLPDGNLSFHHSGVYTLQQGGIETKKSVMNPDNQEIKGVWQVSFDPDWGVSTPVEFTKLISWTEHPHPDIKYYSGTAVYRQTFALDEDVLKNFRVRLNLGELHHLAEVRINGKNAGIWWKKPFVDDISDWVQAGENKLEIAVVNLWPNRLIGDQFLPEDRRRTQTNVVKFTKETPLMPSGLMGPVWLSFAKKNGFG